MTTQIDDESSFEGRPRHQSSYAVTRGFPLIFCLVVVGINIITLSQFIDFPYYWHPDEYGKVLQIQTGVYNFNHPQLLLTLADMINWARSGVTVHEIALSGRWVSLFLSAIAIWALAEIIRREFGLLFATFTVLALSLTPQIFINAQYFKEEASLLFGTSLTLLALYNYTKSHSMLSALLVGMSLGTAMSAKYIGAIMIVPVAILVFARPQLKHFGIIILAASFTFLAFNWQGFIGQNSLLRGLKNEIGHVLTDHAGVAWGPSSPRMISLFLAGSSALVLIAWLYGSLRHLRLMKLRDTKSTTFPAIFFLTPFLFLLATQLSMVVFQRYLLVPISLTVAAAVWTLAEFEKSHSTIKQHLALPIVGILLAYQAALILPVVKTAADNPKLALRNWIADNLPANVKIAQDFYSGLPTANWHSLDPTIPLTTQTVEIPSFHLGDIGSLDELRRKGYDYFVISEASFNRFLDPSATFGGIAVKQKKFYEQVFSELRPIKVFEPITQAEPMFESQIMVFQLN